MNKSAKTNANTILKNLKSAINVTFLAVLLLKAQAYDLIPDNIALKDKIFSGANTTLMRLLDPYNDTVREVRNLIEMLATMYSYPRQAVKEAFAEKENRLLAGLTYCRQHAET